MSLQRVHLMLSRSEIGSLVRPHFPGAITGGSYLPKRGLPRLGCMFMGHVLYLSCP